MSNLAPSRRTLTRSAAWSVPVIAFGAASPAVAATQGPSISRSFSVSRTSSGCASGQRITVTSANDSTSYFKIINATSSTTVTDVYASVLVQKSVVDAIGTSSFTWTSNSTSWAAPQLETGVVYTDPSGTQYYRYYSKYTGTMPTLTSGTLSFPAFTWTSSCSTTLSNTANIGVNGRGMATINGSVQTNVGAWRAV